MLGPLRQQLKEDDVILLALHQTMEQELERIFRLMALLFDGQGLHDAYVGVTLHQSDACAPTRWSFWTTSSSPSCGGVLVPLLDSQVSVETRIDLANRMVGAPLETAEQAVGTLLGSEDGWLRSCAVYAVGALQLHGLESELQQFEKSPDPELRESAHRRPTAARRRSRGTAAAAAHPG